jgi:hypothetical protein
MRTSFLLSLLLALGCSCGAETPTPSAPPPPPSPVTYEVHEWGLVRGAAGDRVLLSGPHVDPPAVPMAKPVLYFHREGEGALVVDVEVHMVSGRIAESWPTTGEPPAASVAWHRVTIEEGSCRGSRYPTFGEPPCSHAGVGVECEATALASVETDDSDCLVWPHSPLDDGPTLAWNHLFYRGEIPGAPPVPLRIEPLPDGTLRVTSTTRDPIPGRLVRVRRGNGVPAVADAVAIASPPAPGAIIVIPAPTEPPSSGAPALAEGLRAAGLTGPEIDAFRRAWDTTLFGTTETASAESPRGAVTTTPVAASPMPIPVATTSLVYVLPASAADALSTLSFTPPPRAVRRAIVAWIDEATFPR